MTDFWKRRLCATLAAASLLGAAALPAGAIELAPKKLEDFAHFTTAGGADCRKAAFGVGRTFASRIIDTGASPNGVSRFGLNIPPGKAFVMTSAQVRVAGGTPFSGVTVRLLNQSGAGGGTEYIIASEEYNAGGGVTVSATFPTGVLIRSFTNFCAEANGGDPLAIQGVVHGFLIDG